MKIIFLDIDGVLTLQKSGWKFFDSDCVIALKKVLDNTDANMVLSSCWRHGFIDWDENGKGCGLVHHTQAIRKIQELLKPFDIDPSRLIDKTPDLITPSDNERGEEIDKWLQAHTDVECFVILDDDSDMAPHMDKLVQTDIDVGMTLENADEAIAILQK